MKYSVLFFLILFTACSNKDNLSELQKKVSENESDATDKQKMLIENLRITYNDPIEPKKLFHDYHTHFTRREIL